MELHSHCPEVFERMEVYLDDGFERGTDILKAIALGATAVGIGRPFLYSLAYGEEGAVHLIQSKLLDPALLRTNMLTWVSSERRARDCYEAVGHSQLARGGAGSTEHCRCGLPCSSDHASVPAEKNQGSAVDGRISRIFSGIDRELSSVGYQTHVESCRLEFE